MTAATYAPPTHARPPARTHTLHPPPSQPPTALPPFGAAPAQRRARRRSAGAPAIRAGHERDVAGRRGGRYGSGGRRRQRQRRKRRRRGGGTPQLPSPRRETRAPPARHRHTGRRQRPAAVRVASSRQYTSHAAAVRITCTAVRNTCSSRTDHMQQPYAPQAVSRNLACVAVHITCTAVHITCTTERITCTAARNTCSSRTDHMPSSTRHMQQQYASHAQKYASHARQYASLARQYASLAPKYKMPTHRLPATTTCSNNDLQRGGDARSAIPMLARLGCGVVPPVASPSEHRAD